MTGTNWSDPNFHEEVNAKFGVTLGARRLSASRFAGICRRAGEWNMIDPETVNVDSAQIMFVDLRNAVNLLIADSMARSFWRRWRVRLFG
jgi:hypothetical protein